MDIIRVLRVIEYVGPRDKIERQLEGSSVKGTKTFNGITIRSVIVGEFPEIVGTLQEAPDASPN